MTNTSFKLIFAALAATAALTACTKEITPGQVDADPKAPEYEGSRIIAVSFAPQSQTKTALDGLQPTFAKEDSILISNGKAIDTCEVIIDAETKTATVTTSLDGQLKAVYPYRAAKKKDNDITDVSVSSTQSGKFADANICMATMTESGGESLTFVNKTAILRFYVDESIGVTAISVTGGKITSSGSKITVTAPSGKTLADVTDDPGKRICYVAVKPETAALTFTGTTNTQKIMTRKTANVTLEAGKMYNAFIPYYVDLGDAGKWGYCNVGAFLPEEQGEYFAWGETIGHKLNAYKNGFEGGHNFNWANAPFNGANEEYDETYFNTTKDIVCPNGTLALKYDAANVNWGNGWRLPTKGDFETLKSKATFDNSSSPAYIFKSESKSVFFPAAGLSNGTVWTENIPYYWSSSLYSGGYVWIFFANNYAINPGDRKTGMTVRPFYDENAILQQSVLLPGEFTVNGEGKKVKFTRGNLYWKSDNWYVEKNQWDYHTKGDNGVGKFYFSTDATIARTQPYSDPNASASDKLFCDEERPLTIESESGFFCLSGAEWLYLVSGRTTQTNRCVRAKINGYNGLLIFPDGYSQGAAVTGTGIGSVNTDKEEFPTENLPLDRWSVMESDGVLFLAVNGNLTENGNFYPDTAGCLWTSSTEYVPSAQKVIVNYVRATDSLILYYDRKYGYSIRLVKKITPKDQK